MTLLDDIEQFLERHALSATALGQQALGDRHFVRQLRAGRDVRMSTVERVRRFMDEYRGDGEHTGVDTAPSDQSATGQINDLSERGAA
ncbi:hypothetical protein [Novosphingobium aromaticivorans]|uniref:hypothetical protein n=1 Tax=Novosphingobium aromaticivorans TaxID=48935 RepID=UPI00115F829E|nr:hypothetical protein [Novosphingobium aromaticivorans]